MSETLSLPVLPLDDIVVLPTMVVPLDTSAPEVRAAIEAAQVSAAGTGTGTAGAPRVPGISGQNGRPGARPRVLLVPRVSGRYAAVGTLGEVEQVGRTPDGKPAAVIRGMARVSIGSGTVGPGAALWVEGTVAEEPPASQRAQELAREYRQLATAILEKRGAWQVVDVLQSLTDPSALADFCRADQFSIDRHSWAGGSTLALPGGCWRCGDHCYYHPR